MTPTAARALMHDWTTSPALRIHMECVAACMSAYAAKLDPTNTDRWQTCGLLHDFDYERHPNAAHSPLEIAYLRQVTPYQAESHVKEAA